jgi:hypothetical protein
VITAMRALDGDPETSRLGGISISPLDSMHSNGFIHTTSMVN